MWLIFNLQRKKDIFFNNKCTKKKSVWGLLHYLKYTYSGQSNNRLLLSHAALNCYMWVEPILPARCGESNPGKSAPPVATASGPVPWPQHAYYNGILKRRHRILILRMWQLFCTKVSWNFGWHSRYSVILSLSTIFHYSIFDQFEVYVIYVLYFLVCSGVCYVRVENNLCYLSHNLFISRPHIKNQGA
jgi:hypothetical protein